MASIKQLFIIRVIISSGRIIPARSVLRGATGGGGSCGGVLAPPAAEHDVRYLELDALRRRRGLALLLVHYHAAWPPKRDWQGGFGSWLTPNGLFGNP